MFLLLFHIWLLLFPNAEQAYPVLEEMYLHAPQKCLDRATKWSSKHPDWPAPHFFLMRLSMDAYQQEQQELRKNRCLRQALSYARRLEKTKHAGFKQMPLYDSLKLQLHSYGNEEYNQLLANDQLEKAQIVERKLKILDLEVIVKEENKKKLAPVDAPLPNISEYEFIESANKFYFGIPSGDEMVESASLAAEKEVFRLINEERKKQGLTILKWDENLARAARYHAFDMATQHYFSHDSHDRVEQGLVQVGGTFERIRKFYTEGFPNSENIAAGNKSPYKTYMQWYHSRGHYLNMFNGTSTKGAIGLAYKPGSPYGWYWVFCTAKR